MLFYITHGRLFFDEFLRQQTFLQLPLFDLHYAINLSEVCFQLNVMIFMIESLN